MTNEEPELSNEERFARHQELLIPFFANQRALVALLADLKYPIDAFLLQEVRVGVNRPLNPGKGGVSPFQAEWFTRDFLKANPPEFDKNRTGSALYDEEGLTPFLDKTSLQWLHVLRDKLDDARASGEAEYAKERESFQTVFLRGFSYSVILAISSHLGTGPTKGSPLPAKAQRLLTQKVQELLQANEAYRTPLMDENYGLVADHARAELAEVGDKLSLEELLSAGMLGLIEGINRYDPGYKSSDGERDAGFAGVAANWIKHYIRRTVQHTAHTIELPVTRQVAAAEFAKLLHRGPELTGARLAAAEQTLTFHIRKNDVSLSKIPAEAVAELRRRHVDWRERVHRFAKAEIVIAQRRLKGTGKAQKDLREAWEANPDSVLADLRASDSAWGKRVVELAEGMLKEVLELPTTTRIGTGSTDGRDYGVSLDDHPAASTHVTPASASEAQDATDLRQAGLDKGLGKLSPKQRLPLTLAFGLDGAKEVGREFLADIVKRSHAETDRLMSERGKKSLPRVLISDAISTEPPAKPTEE